jgi:hypothetical protein
MRKLLTVLLSFWGVALGLVATHATWAQTPTPAAVEEDLVTIPVTVEDIDKKNRTMTVRTADGDRIPLTVPADVQGFDKLKKGEKIDIDYYRAVAVRVVPAGGAGTASQTANAPAAQGGKGPQMTGSGHVTSVNRSDNTAKVKEQNGKTQTMSVRDPSVQNEVQAIKPGDLVEITYTEAVLAAIRPHNASDTKGSNKKK